MPALQVLLRLDSFEEIEPFPLLISPDVQLDYARLVWLSQIIYPCNVPVIHTHVEDVVLYISQRFGVFLPCFLDLIECLFYLLDNLLFELPAQLIFIDLAIFVNFNN